ncbi:MAG: hypothetical protein ACP5D9_03975 [Mariniphaga sp.]
MKKELDDEARKARAAYQRNYMREYRQKNKDALNGYHREWRRNNPDKVRKYNQEYWERKAEKIPIEEKVTILRNEGFSLRQIVKELGISKDTVSRILANATECDNFE